MVHTLGAMLLLLGLAALAWFIAAWYLRRDLCSLTPHGVRALVGAALTVLGPYGLALHLFWLRPWIASGTRRSSALASHGASQDDLRHLRTVPDD